MKRYAISCIAIIMNSLSTDVVNILLIDNAENEYDAYGKGMAELQEKHPVDKGYKHIVAVLEIK